MLLAISSANAADLTTDKIEVISQTPLPSLGISIYQLPSNIQTAKSSDIERSQALDLSNYINQNFAGVNINEEQGNPLQANLNYHGFTASPLLGTPQGLSVYMDGVRMNQPFGDIVSWDLIPKNAIKGMQLYSGSNPLFGLNTLGGAISIQTKDGRNNPGGSMQFTGGSWGRKIGEFEYGGVSKDNSIDYFLAGTWFDEEGWRQHSPSDNKQLFTKLGWRGEKTDLHLTYALSQSDLNGNGVIPKSMLASGYDKVYSWPDNTQNKSHFLNLDWSHYFNDKTVLTGNSYYRKMSAKTLNGDVNGGAFPGIDTSGLTLAQQIIGQGTGGQTAAGYSYATALTRCNGALGVGDEAGEKCNGLINRTDTQQENFGIFSQVSVQNEIFKRPNNYIVGGGFDRSISRFRSTSELGVLTTDQTIIGTGHFENASEGFLSNAKALDSQVDLKGTTNTWSIYGTDTLELTEKISLTGAARYNHVEVDNKDQLTHYTTYPNNIDTTQTLTGNHNYHRLNPSLGIVFTPQSNFNIYGNYNEGSRTPSAIELGCSDPNNPCKLPNAMASDPDLKQVVSKTWEAGIRTKPFSDTNLNMSVYKTRNIDDIMFVSTTTNGDGYFKNFGETERKGFDGSFSTKFNRFSFGGNYSYIDATYQSEDTISSPANSQGTVSCSSDGTNASGHVCITSQSTGLATVAAGNTYGAKGDQEEYQHITQPAGSTTGAVTASNGDTGFLAYNNNNDYTKLITIKKNDRIPLIPKNILKLYLSYDLNDKFTIGANTLTVTNSILRGNENNLDSRGVVGGYTTMDLNASYKPASEWVIFAKVNNVFDRQYATSGNLGLNSLNSNGTPRYLKTDGTAGNYQAISEAFVAPGSPRAAWIGIRWEFGGKKSSGNSDRD